MGVVSGVPLEIVRIYRIGVRIRVDSDGGFEGFWGLQGGIGHSVGPRYVLLHMPKRKLGKSLHSKRVMMNSRRPWCRMQHSFTLIIAFLA